MHKINQISVLERYRLDLTFDDGVRGIVDLSSLVGHGVFSVWKDRAEFENVRIGDTGEITWPAGVDLCPDSLYMQVTGKKLELNRRLETYHQNPEEGSPWEVIREAIQGRA